jgi:LPXTG-motif cell wall anchor domain protein
LSYSAKEAVNQLPNTGGSNSNLLSVIGVFALGLLGFISKKKENN